MRSGLILICFITVLTMAQISEPLSGLSSIDKIPVAITFNADVWGAQEEFINVLNILDKYSIRSTFFFLGKYAELEPDALKLTFAKGHEIGARSYDHSHRLIDMNEAEQKAEIEKTVNLIVDVIGVRPIGFAAPGYFYNNETLHILKDLGFIYDRSARGTLHVSNDRSYWKWQNETKEGIKYVGVFSNQHPFIYDQELYEFPVTYSLNYSPFNLTLGLNPIWWEKINGTDIILSDASWFEELQWNQSRCLDVLRYGLRQQREFGMPLIISFAPHIIGQAEWIWVLEEFIKFALENNTVFLTLNELLDWWFNKSCVRIVKQISRQTITLGESINVSLHLYILKGEIYNVTVTDSFNGLVQNVNPEGEIIENKLIWHFNKLSNNFTISYVMTPQYLIFLNQKIVFRHMTILKQLLLSSAFIDSSSLIFSIRSNSVELNIQINPIIFWAILIFIAMLIIFGSWILYKKIRSTQESHWPRFGHYILV